MVGWSWRRRLPVIVLAAGLITAVELRAAVTIQHAHHRVYQLPTAAVATVVAAGLISGVAAIGLVLVPRPLKAIMVAFVAALAFAGAATALGIGVLVLAAAVVATFAIAPSLRSDGARNLVLAVICGIPLAAGLVTVAIVSAQPPLLRCGRGAVTESQRAWWGSGTGTSSRTSWIRPTSGRVTASGHTFSYACHGPSLVRFTDT
jgi:hypothetical protein